MSQVDLLRFLKKHPNQRFSARDLQKVFPNLSPATLYNNLKCIKKKSLQGESDIKCELVYHDQYNYWVFWTGNKEPKRVEERKQKAGLSNQKKVDWDEFFKNTDHLLSLLLINLKEIEGKLWDVRLRCEGVGFDGLGHFDRSDKKEQILEKINSINFMIRSFKRIKV